MADNHAPSGSVENSETTKNHALHLVCEQIGGKDKLRWMGSLKELKEFVELTLKLSGTWSTVSNNGGFHVFKCTEVTLSYYPGTKTMSFQGPKLHHYRTISLDMCRNPDQSPEATVSDRLPTGQDGAESDAGESDTGDSNDVEQIANPRAEHTCTGCNANATVIKELMQRFSDLEERLLQSDHSTTTCEQLRQRIKTLQEERDSLLTALRLLRDEANGTKESTCQPDTTNESTPDSWQTVQPRKHNKNTKNGKARNDTKTKTRNPHSVNGKQQERVSQNDPRAPKKSVVVLGDSITSNLQGRKLSREAHVMSKSFSGSTVEDMNDFAKPFIRRQPNELILHVGTNNLRQDTPQEISEKIVDLMRSIEQELPDANLAISGLIHRKDDESLNKNIKAVNRSLNKFCNSNGWSFICNDDIREDCLNRGGLHLNRRGVYKLASNFRSLINNN